jgi:hypothetical protein
VRDNVVSHILQAVTQFSDLQKHLPTPVENLLDSFKRYGEDMSRPRKWL